MLGERRTRVVAGAGASGESSPLVVARRRAKETVFAAVLEPYAGEPLVRRVARVPALEQGKACAQTAAIGVSVETQHTVEQVCISYQPGRKRYGPIELDGLIGVVAWADERDLRYAYLGRGTALRHPRVALEAAAESTVYLEPLDTGGYLVAHQGPTDTALVIRARLASRPAVYALDQGGQRSISVRAEGGSGSVRFEAKVGVTYHILDASQTEE